MALRKVAVIGAGPLGRRLAWAVARAGFAVVLEDVLPTNLSRALELAREAGETAPMEFAGTVEDAVRDADIVIDCVPDELESKLEIFSMMDRMAPPRTILLTPTTTQSITDLASCTYRAELCAAFTLSGVFLAEVELPMELEVVYPPQCSPETRDAVRGLWHAMGRRITEREDAPVGLV
jgi:3-hydroxybutyryl-CoA dehydrogenase